MTTNQTIDGVPRRVCHACATLPRNAYCPVCDDEPDAQSKVEPVTMDGKTTIREYVSNSVPEDQISDDWTKEYEECKRRIHRMLQQPVNAEQPAPVAVVLPERREIGLNYPYLSDLDVEWNACLDEVTRLNAKP